MNEAFNDQEEKQYDDAYYYLNDNIKSNEEWKEEIFAFRQRMIEKIPRNNS